MGCGSSTDTTVQPLRPDQVNGDEDETGSKHDGRGDSAVSKGTTDSGVVMEHREVPVLPGAVPRKVPPLTFVRESEADTVTQDTDSGLLQQESTMQERLNSSEILEELLNQGIIPLDQTKEKGSRAGEAYNIMLREDKLKTRLRTKSAHVRGPAPTTSTKEEEEATLTPVEPLQSPLTPDPTPGPLLYSQNVREAREGGDCVREARGDGIESKEVTTAGKKEGSDEGGGESRDDNGEGRGGTERISEHGDRAQREEEWTQVEELNAGQLLSALGELESDSSFQHAENKEEVCTYVKWLQFQFSTDFVLLK
ncbi:hypothetical protein PAMP_008059 [Pampus punctatissimus]